MLDIFLSLLFLFHLIQMVLFVPINPPHELTPPGGTDASQLSLAPVRIEEQIGELLRQYGLALNDWTQGQFSGAVQKLEALCENPLIIDKQDKHVESECNAYCRELGGMDIDRLRCLCFANAGLFCIYNSKAVDSTSVISGTASRDHRLLSSEHLTDVPESTLLLGLQRLMAALEYDSAANMSQYLAASQCAIHLGQLDVAISTLTRGLATSGVNMEDIAGDTQLSTNSKANKLSHTSKVRFSPHQWWGIKAYVQTSLMRGDTTVVYRIIQNLSPIYPNICHLFGFPNDKCLSSILPMPLKLPPVLPMSIMPLPRPLAALASIETPAAQDQLMPKLNILSNDNNISLVDLGKNILQLYSSSSTLYTQIACSIDAKIADNKGKDAHDINDRSDPAQLIDNDSGQEEDVDNGTVKNTKRQGSVSGDEMPAKRRSTRFMKRAASIQHGSITGVAGSSGLAQGSSSNSRIATSRVGGGSGGVSLRGIELATNPFKTTALMQAKETWYEWFAAIGLAETKGVESVCESGLKMVPVLADQEKKNSQKRAAKYDSTSRDKMRDNWGLNLTKSKQPSSKAEPSSSSFVANDSDYLPSLRSFIETKVQSAKRSIAIHSPMPDLVTVSECQSLMDNNNGVVDMLIRYVNQAVLEFANSPAAFMQLDDLKDVCLKILVAINDGLLGWVCEQLLEATSSDTYVRAIQHGIFALILLSSASAKCSSDSLTWWCTLRQDWVQTIDYATERTNTNEDIWLVQYRLTKLWTCYEMEILAGNLPEAQQLIDECENILNNIGVSCSVVVCAFSQTSVTHELVKERQSHLVMFLKLQEIGHLSTGGDQTGAVNELHKMLAPFVWDNSSSTISFKQRVSATRKMADLYRQLDKEIDEMCATLYELYLYLSKLFEESDNSQLPLQAALARCVQCLERIHAIATKTEDNMSLLRAFVYQNGHVELICKLMSLSFAIASHCSPGVPPDCITDTNALPPVFTGLAIWLVARLTWTIKPLCFAAAISSHQKKLSNGTLRSMWEVGSGSSSMSESAYLQLSGNGQLKSYIQFLNALHCLMGERGLCTAGDGSFLKHLLSVCCYALESDRDNLSNWDVASSCLQCLFDIRLHSSDIDIHPCKHLEMDSHSANVVYMLVEPDLLDSVRNRKGAGLRGDLKSIIEKTGSSLQELEVDKLPHLSQNLDTIDDYLDGTSMPSFKQVRQFILDGCSSTSPLNCLVLKRSIDDENMPATYKTLFFVRAAVQHDLLLFRMKSGMTRAIEDYDDVIDDYKTHVALNASSAEAWYHLGRAYADLASELLLGTANEIVEIKSDIATLQRLCLSACLQALILLPLLTSAQQKNSNNADEEEDGEEEDLVLKLHVRTYSLVGSLLYRIAAKPLSLNAFQVLPSNVMDSEDDEERQQWDIGNWKGGCEPDRLRDLSKALSRRYMESPTGRQIYELVRIMIAHTSRLEPENWKWSYMLGKTMAKLGDPVTACALYLKACHLAIETAKGSWPHTASNVALAAFNGDSTVQFDGNTSREGSATIHHVNSIPDVAIDALYKLLMAIAKLLHLSQIQPDIALRFIKGLPFPAPLNEEPSLCLNPEPENENDAAGVMLLQAAIRRLASLMCSSDKSRQNHRSIFLLAWIDHHALGNSESAKQALSPLFHLRHTTKQLASFYKTEFEAPGKHYLYLEKYLGLYVETLVATVDLDGIQMLVRKLKRSPDFLYDPAAIVAKASDAETNILQKLVHRLGCPRFVVDSSGKEHILLQNDLNDNSNPPVQVFSVARHCRLHRAQLNAARDHSRDNISLFVALRAHLADILRGFDGKALAGEGVNGSSIFELKQAQQRIEDYLKVADSTLTLFGYILECKKRLLPSEDPAVLDKFHDWLADLYMLILFKYGRLKPITTRSHHLMHHDGNLDEILTMYRLVVSHLSSTNQTTNGNESTASSSSFWKHILFDESAHESSQQYQLLDPLLEFNINKLLDSVRDARSMQPDNRFVDKTRTVVADLRTQETPLAVQHNEASKN